jgi:hypothetical protein
MDTEMAFFSLIIVRSGFRCLHGFSFRFTFLSSFQLVDTS